MHQDVGGSHLSGTRNSWVGAVVDMKMSDDLARSRQTQGTHVFSRRRRHDQLIKRATPERSVSSQCLHTNASTRQKPCQRKNAKRGELNWLATQSMIQLLAPLSLIDTSKTATGQSVKDVNRLVRQAHCKASEKLHHPVVSNPVFVSFADASWANRTNFGSQCGYLCVGTERSLLDGSAALCCPISWHSRRCPRVARSSGSAETQAATQAQEETEFIRLLCLEIAQGGYDDTTFDQEISKVGGCVIIDAKGVFDAIHRSESAALSMQDERSAVEGLALREAIGRTRSLLRWCHSEANVAGALTKTDNRAHELLRKFLQSRVWRIVWDPECTSSKKLKQQKKRKQSRTSCWMYDALIENFVQDSPLVQKSMPTLTQARDLFFR